MRRLLAVRFAALGLIGLLSPAFAADYDLPILRGSDMFVPATPTYFSWQGPYAGGQLGFTSATADFSRATQPMVAFSLRNSTILDQMTPDQWQVLGKSSNGAGAFGGFVGYNFQWENAVIGLAQLCAQLARLRSAEPSLGREQTVNGLIDDVNIDASGRMHISDFRPLGRDLAGIDHFLPYGRSASRSGAPTWRFPLWSAGPKRTPIPQSLPASSYVPDPRVVGVFRMRTARPRAGLLVRLFGRSRVDYAFTQNIFARGIRIYPVGAVFFDRPLHAQPPCRSGREILTACRIAAAPDSAAMPSAGRPESHGPTLVHHAILAHDA